MSSAFGRVLLMDMLLGLRIQPVLAAECGKHLRAQCIQLWSSIIHTSCAGQNPSKSKRPKMPSCRANQRASSLASEKLVEGCPGHLVQQQSGHSTCWFPPPTRQATYRGRASKKSLMQRSLTHGSAGHADELNLED